MSSVTGLVGNELQKSWRSRWLVFAVVFGLFLLITAGLYAFYVYRDHRWSPPAPTPWQTVLRQQIAADELSITNLKTIQQQQPNARISQGGGGPFGRAESQGIQNGIHQDEVAIADDQYLLDNNVAPVQSNSLAVSALFTLGGILMFLFVRIFGWLASEQIAGERSDRTIAILLSRPATRDQVLFAKAAASFLMGLGTVVLALLLVYGAYAFFSGSAGPLGGQVGVAVDGSQPLGPGNLVQMSPLLFTLMCLGAAMLAVLGVQGMSLLISVLTTRWAAIGITLAILFAAPVVSGIIALVITLITGSSGNADFLNYLFYNLLTPVGTVAPAFGSGPSAAGEGMTAFGHQLLALGIWTVAFFGAAYVLFHRKQETG